MPKRGCGDSRTDGGIYIESETSEFGMPLEHFLIDPPIHELNGQPVMQALNLTARGVQVLKGSDGSTPHIFDVIGAEHYPDVLDFFEETRALGASRRCELPASEYAKLLPFKSRLLLIHPRAAILNHGDYYVPHQDLHFCPKRIETHASELVKGPNAAQAWTAPIDCCARLYWHDLTGQVDRDQAIPTEHDGMCRVTRTLPCGQKFSGYYRHPSLEPQYAPALFLSLPIARIVLVDPNGKHDAKRKKLEGAQIPVEVVNE